MIKEQIRELQSLTTYLHDDEKKIITKAIKFSEHAHKDQLRKSGDPFVTHPIEVAKILTTIKFDASGIAAGLLHDIIEDTDISISEITETFGDQISELVQGLTKISKFSLKINKQKLGENYRKLILASSKDLRVILIKLADRLHNMQDELEDLSFQSINPEARNSVIDRLNYLNSKGENIVDEIRYELKKIFLNEDINCKIDGRIKSAYSIWNKIKNKNISFEQLSDIMAFRIITNSTRECYRCLGIIHRQFPHIQGRFKDFISSPKSNGYRALHTSVMGPKNKKIEIQFRSNVMNQIADFGVAAHWKYKDPKSIKEKDTKEYKWMHDLIDLMNTSANQDELLENSKISVFKNEIFVFTPKGDLIELPTKATAIDFAYAIHTQIGDKCVGAKINEKLQPLKTILKNGDQIEIITSEESQPSPLWERFAATSRVKSQIRGFFRSKKRDEYIIFGKEILNSFFIKENYDLNKITLEKIKKEFNLSDIEDIYEMIGAGRLTAFSVIKRIYPEFKNKTLKEFKIQSESTIHLKGLTAGMSYHLAGCCTPLKGDTIVGIVTAGIGVAVHTIECETLSSYSDDPERWLNISWDLSTKNKSLSNASISVVLKNQPGSLGKITSVIAKNNGNISNINFSIRKIDFFEIIIDIEVRDANHLKNIIAALRLLSEVSSLERIKG